MKNLVIKVKRGNRYLLLEKSFDPVKAIRSFIGGTTSTVVLLRLAELHELAGELEREDTAEGVRVRALLTPAQATRFARFAVVA